MVHTLTATYDDVTGKTEISLPESVIVAAGFVELLRAAVLSTKVMPLLTPRVVGAAALPPGGKLGQA